MSSDCDSWMTRQQLEILGVAKLVNDMDSKEAARLGLMTRPLTTAAIEKHLDDFGLEPEFSTHSLMKGLSGGQKVKVVLAAAMWNNPHILVMDEPTNFLDRDSLGALAMVRRLRCCRLCRYFRVPGTTRTTSIRALCLPSILLQSAGQDFIPFRNV
jgi:ABC-type Na+ transport system ATPase subunit NatA